MINTDIFGDLPRVALSPEREKKLISQLPSEAAQTKLAKASMWESMLFLRSCASNELSSGDLFSMAWDGLVRAARNYQTNYQTKHHKRFFDYAKHYLRGNLRRTLRLRSTVVRNAAGQVDLDSIYAEETESLLITYGLVPTACKFDFSQMDAEDEARELAPLLKQLPADDFDLLHKRFFKQQTYTEIAQKRGVSRQAIETQVKRSLRRLRWMLKLNRIRKELGR